MNWIRTTLRIQRAPMKAHVIKRITHLRGRGAPPSIAPTTGGSFAPAVAKLRIAENQAFRNATRKRRGSQPGGATGLNSFPIDEP
jgi:hypothetical protein